LNYGSLVANRDDVIGIRALPTAKPVL